MKTACELCKSRARIHCASDQVNLCWDCDAKVHSANFLVARHSRSLLCRVCQSPTPWSASGSALEPTFSVCRRCVNGKFRDEIREEETAEEEICEKSSSPPPIESSSDEERGEAAVSRKRCRVENDLPTEDDGCVSSRPPRGTAAATGKIQSAARVSELGVLRRFHREGVFLPAVDLNSSHSG